MSVTIQNQNRKELIQFAVKKIFGIDNKISLQGNTSKHQKRLQISLLEILQQKRESNFP